MRVSKEDYDLLAWENKNFANYLKNTLGANDDQISQIANGWQIDNKLTIDRDTLDMDNLKDTL